MKTKLECWISKWKEQGFSDNIIKLALSTPFISELEKYKE
jgi:hypothetical protein